MEAISETLVPEGDIHEAIDLLLKKKLPGAPVVDGDDKPIGILSEKDCLKITTAEAFDGLPKGKVSDYMSRPVLTIRSDASLIEMVGLFLNRPFRYLPVVDDDGVLAGVVSRASVLQAIASMRDNRALYGTEEQTPPEESFGVHSAMQRARGK
jgi:CBS domain-containing protein